MAIQALQAKVVEMAAEAGGEAVLDQQEDHYYEREVIEDALAGRLLSVTEAVEAVTYLRQLITSQEAS